MSRDLFKKALWIVPLGVAVNVGFSFLRTDRTAVGALSAFSWSYLGLAFGLGLVPWFIGSLRATLWSRFFGWRLGYPDHFQTVIVGELGSALAPAAMGQNGFKILMLARKGLTASQAASLVALTTGEDFFFFLIAMPSALALSSSSDRSAIGRMIPRIGPGGCFALAAGIVSLAIYWGYRRRRTGHFAANSEPDTSSPPRRFADFRTDFFRTFHLIGRRGKWMFGLMLGLAAVQWTCRYTVISALLAGLHMPVYPVKYFLFQWIVFTIATFTPMPGGAGGAEAAFCLVYSPYVPSGLIAMVMVAWRLLTYYFQIILAAGCYSWMLARSRRPPFPRSLAPDRSRP
jgi:uncharacterized membrane protein YbhN (UPF0104 family)